MCRFLLVSTSSGAFYVMTGQDANIVEVMVDVATRSSLQFALNESRDPTMELPTQNETNQIS